MSEARKTALLQWLPAIVALAGFIGNAIYVGRWTGIIEQRIVAVEKHPDTQQQISMFVSRNEFNLVKNAQEAETNQTRDILRTMDAKLDRLIEREAVRLSKNE